MGLRRSVRAATPKINSPAGTSRNPAKKKGVVWSRVPFMATMAVPQKKKGEISSSHPHQDCSDDWGLTGWAVMAGINYLINNFKKY
jgi:hypothetical protein